MLVRYTNVCLHSELKALTALMQEFWGVCKGLGERNDEKMQMGVEILSPKENRRILEEKIPGRRACEERESCWRFWLWHFLVLFNFIYTSPKNRVPPLSQSHHAHYVLV